MPTKQIQPKQKTTTTKKVSTAKPTIKKKSEPVKPKKMAVASAAKKTKTSTKSK